MVNESNILPFDFNMTGDDSGRYARSGFNYQDHIGACFCIDMLLNENLSEIWFEHQDDITLIWKNGQQNVTEFVQVKSENRQSRWSINSWTHRPNGSGSSLIEKSIRFAQSAENTKFRIVTGIGVNRDLEILTYKLNHPVRSSNKIQIITIANLIMKRMEELGDLSSINFSTIKYCVEQCYWEERSRKVSDIASKNVLILSNFINEYISSIELKQVYQIYRNLLDKVKVASFGDRKENHSIYKIDRSQLRSWLSDNVKNSGLIDDKTLNDIFGIPDFSFGKDDELYDELICDDKIKDDLFYRLLSNIKHLREDGLLQTDGLRGILSGYDEGLNSCPSNDKACRILANHILKNHIYKFVEIICNNHNNIDKNGAKELFYIIEPSWVNVNIAISIKECINKNDNKPILIIYTARNRFTLDMYLKRAIYRPYLKDPFICDLNGKSLDYDEIKDEIENTLLLKFGSRGCKFYNIDDKHGMIKEKINNFYTNYNRPTFVVIRYDTIDPDYNYKLYMDSLLKLHKDFDNVNFIILSTINDFDQKMSDGVEYIVLKPHLKNGEEDIWREENCEARISLKETFDITLKKLESTRCVDEL